MSLSRSVFAALAALTLCIRPALAQSDDDPQISESGGGAGLVHQHLFYVATNTALGMIGSALTAWVKGNPIDRALFGGAVGGAVTWTGMRVLGTEKRELAFVGLQTASLGASIARNAGNGIGLLDELTFTPYPLYVTFRPNDPDARFSVRLSAGAVVATAWFLSESEWDLEPDWTKSMWAGVLVLRSPKAWEPLANGTTFSCPTDKPCVGGLLGRQASGVVFYTAGQGAAVARQVLTHELEHVAQFSRESIPYAVPVSDAMLSLFGEGGQALSRYVVLDWFTPLGFGNEIVGRLGDGRTYLELEADAMRGALRLCERPGQSC